MAIESTFKCPCGRKIGRLYNRRALMKGHDLTKPVWGVPSWDRVDGDAALLGITCGDCSRYHEFIEAPKGHPHANVRRS